MLPRGRQRDFNVGCCCVAKFWEGMEELGPPLLSQLAWSLCCRIITPNQHDIFERAAAARGRRVLFRVICFFCSDSFASQPHDIFVLSANVSVESDLHKKNNQEQNKRREMMLVVANCLVTIKWEISKSICWMRQCRETPQKSGSCSSGFLCRYLDWRILQLIGPRLSALRDIVSDHQAWKGSPELKSRIYQFPESTTNNTEEELYICNNWIE